MNLLLMLAGRKVRKEGTDDVDPCGREVHKLHHSKFPPDTIKDKDPLKKTYPVQTCPTEEMSPFKPTYPREVTHRPHETTYIFGTQTGKEGYYYLDWCMQ